MENKKHSRKGDIIFSKYSPGDGIKKAVDLSREDILFEIELPNSECRI